MNTEAKISTKTFFIEQTRVIKASREQVFRAWTDPAILQKWFGPAQKHCPAADLNVHVGGAYRIEVHGDPCTVPASGRTEATAIGRYTKIIPNELLQFTWIPSWNEVEESVVTISLRDVDAGTELHLRHERLLTDESRQGHQAGWAGSFEKLAALLEGQN